jgi:hypothetical protein
MRQPILQIALLTAAGILGACAEESPMSAQYFAKPASATAPSADSQVGYSAEDRRRADCLATFPRYDVRTGLVPAGPGEMRQCPF